MKKLSLLLCVAIAACSSTVQRSSQESQSTPQTIAQQRDLFQKHSDILVSQFDFKPDVDDVHAVAALGSMLIHPDFAGINYIAVNGTMGIQGGKYIDARTLMALAFGKESINWTDAYKNRVASVELVHNLVRAVLAQGGKAWVQEAGQSDFTRDWVTALLSSGVQASVIKNNVIVVQHSIWNENQTSPEALEFVKEMTTYQTINDGNKDPLADIPENKRGPITPNYVDASKNWLKSATTSENTNHHTRKLWQEAVRIIDAESFEAKYSIIPQGGVDFSDNVEVWWILNLNKKADSVSTFWNRYIVNE